MFGVNMSVRRLYRSKTDKIVSGVCGGIAEYLEIDSTLVRIVWVILIFAGIGVPAYIIAWILIPENPVDYEIIEPTDEGEPLLNVKEKRQKSAGILLFLLGILLLIRNFFPWFGLERLWPVVIVAAGIWLIFSSKKEL